MKLRVKGDHISIETLEEVLDILIRSRTVERPLRVQTSFVVLLIKELLDLKKNSSQVCEFNPYDEHPGLDPYPSEEKPDAYGISFPQEIKLDSKEHIDCKPHKKEEAIIAPTRSRLASRARKVSSTRSLVTTILVVINIFVFAFLFFILF